MSLSLTPITPYELDACPCGGSLEITTDAGALVERCSRGRLCTNAARLRPEYSPTAPLAALPPDLRAEAARVLRAPVDGAPARASRAVGRTPAATPPPPAPLSPEATPVPPTAAPASTEPAAPLPAFAADTPLAERLRVLRTRAGLTPPQLIARSGLSKTMVYNLGNGATRSAEAPVLEKLAEALGCPVALLGTPRPPQPPRRAHEVRRDAPAAAATAAEDAPNQMRVAVAATRDADDSQRDVPTPPAGSSPAVVPAHAAGGIPAAAAATLAYAEYRFWIEHIQMPFARVELLVAGAILGVDVEAERDAAAAEALINQANGPTYTLWDESRLGEGRELDDALLQLQNVRDAVDNLTSALTALREADRRLASEEASRA